MHKNSNNNPLTLNTSNQSRENKRPSSHNYIIGSGWWCPAPSNKPQLHQSLRKLYGSDLIRGQAFSRLWLASIDRFTQPKEIIIVDSHSPIKPESEVLRRAKLLELPLNAGHSVEHIGKYSGWTRSVIAGLNYAMLSDADYFVYVEQDALLFGEDFVEQCIAKMTRPFMFGHPGGTPQPLQQSVFIIRKDGYEHFLSRLIQLPLSDRELSPENKFAMAAGQMPIKTPVNFYKRLTKKLRGYDYLPFGYGRTRPLDQAATHFYFQHASLEELKLWSKLTDIPLPEHYLSDKASA